MRSETIRKNFERAANDGLHLRHSTSQTCSTHLIIGDGGELLNAACRKRGLLEIDHIMQVMHGQSGPAGELGGAKG